MPQFKVYLDLVLLATLATALIGVRLYRGRFPSWKELRRFQSDIPLAMLFVVLFPLIAVVVYRGKFTSFKDAFLHFRYLADTKNKSVEVSQVTVRVDQNRIADLRPAIQRYVARKELIARYDVVNSILLERKILSFLLVGPAFQILMSNSEHENIFLATFSDYGKEDWTVYRDDFVAVFAATFGKANIQVIE